LYVALNGTAIVTHDDPNAAQVATWLEWTIDLQAFADQGVDLTNVNTIALGLGDKNNPQPGGTGTMYFDDIRLNRPQSVDPGTDGLVAHWTFDEGAGTTVVDSTGNIPDGTFEGDPEWVAGKFGAALEFDGDDWVNLGTPPELVITEAISISCWVNPAGFVGRQGFVHLDAGYALKVHEEGRLCFTTPGLVDHESANTILEAGTWQHVAATFQPEQSEGLVFYLNGVETERMTSSAINAGTGPFRIGNNQWSELLTGLIDEVMIYNRILSDLEILYLAGN